MFARLADGATVAQADEDLRAVAARLAATYPVTNAALTGRVADLRTDHIPDDVSLVLWLMMGAATLVLFIAC